MRGGRGRVCKQGSPAPNPAPLLLLELPQKSQIAVIQSPDVVDLV